MVDYALYPQDLLIFRQIASNSRGLSVNQVVNNPLNPIPFVGAVRRFDKDACISFFSLTANKDLYFPLPFDVVVVNDKLVFGGLSKTDVFCSVSGLNSGTFINFPAKDVEKRSIVFFDSISFVDYLLCRYDNIANRSRKILADTIYLYEERVGIEIDDETRTTKEGQLYLNVFLRFDEKKEAGVYISCDREIPSSYLFLGGESKVVKLVSDEKLSDLFGWLYNKQEEVKDIIKSSKFFKIVLLTPTNYPCEIDSADLVAQLVRRPMNYAGLLSFVDKSGNERVLPTKVLSLIPPGAVFYYKIKTQNIYDFIEYLFNKFWMQPAFFRQDIPYFELVDSKNPLCLGLSIIGGVKEEYV